MHATIDQDEAYARLRAAGCVLLGEIVYGTEWWRLPNGEEMALTYELRGVYPEQMIIEAERLAKQA